MPFSGLKRLTAKYVYQIWQKECNEAVLVSNKFYEILPKLPDKLFSFCNTMKGDTVLNRLIIIITDIYKAPFLSRAHSTLQVYIISTVHNTQTTIASNHI